MENSNLTYRCIVYQEKEYSFTAVCLDLDIVEEGHVSMEEAVLSINEAVVSHLAAAAKLNNPEELLFRPAPKEYWDKLTESTKKTHHIQPMPFQLYTLLNPASKVVYA